MNLLDLMYQRDVLGFADVHSALQNALQRTPDHSVKYNIRREEGVGENQSKIIVDLDTRAYGPDQLKVEWHPDVVLVTGKQAGPGGVPYDEYVKQSHDLQFRPASFTLRFYVGPQIKDVSASRDNNGYLTITFLEDRSRPATIQVPIGTQALTQKDDATSIAPS
jgi:HSP20 family molecular chaperone IbpA